MPRQSITARPSVSRPQPAPHPPTHPILGQAGMAFLDSVLSFVEGSTLKYLEKVEMHSRTVYFSQIPVWQTTDITILVVRWINFYCTQDVHCVTGEVRGLLYGQPSKVTRNSRVQLVNSLILSFSFKFSYHNKYMKKKRELFTFISTSRGTQI